MLDAGARTHGDRAVERARAVRAARLSARVDKVLGVGAGGASSSPGGIAGAPGAGPAERRAVAQGIVVRVRNSGVAAGERAAADAANVKDAVFRKAGRALGRPDAAVAKQQAPARADESAVRKAGS